MYVYRSYMCDHGHAWIIRKQKDEQEMTEDVFCSEGHEAITCVEEVPADEVQIVIRPAERVADQIRNQRILEDNYWLVLLDKEGEELTCSKEAYSWETAVNKGRMFKGKTAERAQQLWKLRNL